MPVVFGVVSNVLGGSTYYVQKLALESWPPALLIMARLLLSGVPFLLLMPRGWKATRADWARMGITGVFGLALPHLVGSHGLLATDSVNGALLVGLEPIAIVLLSVVFLRERLSAVRVFGIFLGLVGAAMIVVRGDPSRLFDIGSSRGNLLMAAQAMLWAIYTVAAKPTLERVPPMAFSALTSFIALFALAPFGFFELSSLTSRSFALEPLVSIGYLGLAVSFGSALLWNVALVKLAPSQMAALVFLQPVVGAIAGALGGERITGLAIFGAVLVLGGAWLVERLERRAPSSELPKALSGSGASLGD